MMPTSELEIALKAIPTKARLHEELNAWRECSPYFTERELCAFRAAFRQWRCS